MSDLLIQTEERFERESESSFQDALDTLKRLEKGDDLIVSGLKGSSIAYLFSSFFKNTKKPILIILPDPEVAEKICEDITFFVGDESKVLYYPPWEVLPYDKLSPYPEIVGKRLDVLVRLFQGGPFVVVTTPRAVMQKVFPWDELAESVEFLKVGEELERSELVERLIVKGYRREDMVEEMGDIGIRGGILDIFPSNVPSPVRIEFVGDQIESIRTFSQETQRSIEKVDEISIIPFSESFAPICRDEDEPATVAQSRYSSSASLSSFFEYLSEEFLVCLHNKDVVRDEAGKFEKEIKDAWKWRGSKESKSLEPEKLYITSDLFHSAISNMSNVFVEDLSVYNPQEDIKQCYLRSESIENFRKGLESGKGEILKPLAEKVKEWLKTGWKVHFVARLSGEGERLGELLEGYDIHSSLMDGKWTDGKAKNHIEITLGTLNKGLRIPSIGLVIITEEEIFGQRIRRRHVPTRRVDTIKLSLGDMQDGDFSVHVNHGVGIFRGLKRLNVGEVEGDYIYLEYLGGDRLYVPVFNMNVIQKYIGGKGAHPAIDKLGGVTWAKARAKVKEAAQKVAKELLDIYAARKALKGFSFSKKDRNFHEFEAAFEHEETPDQMKAIEDVLKGMESPSPMDMLVCGDVGYGKTEVALRASFKAVWDGKQVAFLVPTTILAQQHFETFKRRFAPYAVNVEVLSRFKTNKEQKEIAERVSTGEVDIIIGTHRILQGDIMFKDLGLVIIDEEQRFGVAQKEKLKKMKRLVDLLILTATPIPRTLHMALGGLRNMSIINTPPEDRLSIKTFISRFDKRVIQDAVQREMDRGGQIFFVHNRVHNIEAMATFLRKLIPEATLGIAHGQMDKGALEKVMLSFLKKDYDVLLCTSLIESGLDIPSANTIIINRADRFGLSQLYQLRGRVGRSHHRAYAYMLVPDEASLTPEAMKRLGALEEMSDLGSGFRLATHDLEIRGAGELLGTSQSGQIARVGFEMYTKLLEDTVAELKGEERLEEIDPEIKTSLPSYIPEKYVPSSKQRLLLYKRLATAGSASDLTELMEEIDDRYGNVPDQLKNLFGLMEIKQVARLLMIKEITLKKDVAILSFHEKSKVSPVVLVDMVTNSPQKFKLTPDCKLRIKLEETVPLLTAVRKALKPLLQGDKI